MKWIRTPVASPGSPALERFFGLLAETPYAWYVTSHGKIRTRQQGAEMCAVTGVVRYQSGATFSVGDWVRAADVIGISYEEAGLIVKAADAPAPGSARMLSLRRRLLAAARIAASSATAPEIPDEMDRALADLVAAHAGTVHAGEEDVLLA